MIQVILRFFRFNVVNDHPMVYWGLGFVWLLILIAAASSLRSLDISRSRKWAWFLLILLVPILGLAVYAISCLIGANWTSLKALFAQPSVAKTVQTK